MYKEEILKRQSGQSGSADGHPYLRDMRLEIRVSPREKRSIEQSSLEKGFGTVAQYVRAQALAPGQAHSAVAQHKALLDCAYQFNKMGNNLNQIARHLNRGDPLSEEVRLALFQILECAEGLLNEARDRSRNQRSRAQP